MVNHFLKINPVTHQNPVTVMKVTKKIRFALHLIECRSHCVNEREGERDEEGASAVNVEVFAIFCISSCFPCRIFY